MKSNSYLAISLLCFLLLLLCSNQPLRMGYDGPYLLQNTNGTFRMVGVGDYGEIYDSLLSSQNNAIMVSTHSGQFRFKIVPDKLNTPEMIYKQPDSLVAVSHLEGNFNEFVSLLIRTHIVDSAFNWQWRNNHLVILGNAVGGGKDNIALLWLIYSLDQQSQKCGGKVHYILGENEEKLLEGKLSPLAAKYNDLSYNLSVPYSYFWGENSFLGNWLRLQNTVELIGETLYMSGNKLKEGKVKNRRMQEVKEGIYNLFSIMSNTKDGSFASAKEIVKKKINKIGAQNITVGFLENSDLSAMVKSINTTTTLEAQQLPALVLYNEKYMLMEPTGLMRPFN